MLKKLLKQAWLLLVMMVVGTLIDWAVHSSRDAWYVTADYYSNKILFGVVWGVFSVYLLRKVLAVNTWKGMALGVPAMIALFLQTKYFYQGRDLSFVVIFLFLHFLMFLPASFFIFRRYQDAFLEPTTTPPVRRWGSFALILIGLEAMFYLVFHLFPATLH
jgi:hypothetical protein